MKKKETDEVKSRQKKPVFAHAGTDLHDIILQEFRNQRLIQGKVELRKKRDYIDFRDNGFSVEKSIRDANGKSVKVYDEKQKKEMISIPDFVDYADDLICDIKTGHIDEPPDEGGIFVTEETNMEKVEIPDDYEDATDELYALVIEEIKKTCESQFKRYKEAYKQATGRDPPLLVYPIINALVKHELLNNKDSKHQQYPVYVARIE
ncbi:MAG: hypothetical protein ACFFDT_36830 [Candidatus Hodarchaeota archaeon]